MGVDPSVIVFLLSQEFGIQEPSVFGREVTADEHRFAETLRDLIEQTSHGECEIDEDIYLYDGLGDEDDEEDDD